MIRLIARYLDGMFLGLPKPALTWDAHLDSAARVLLTQMRDARNWPPLSEIEAQVRASGDESPASVLRAFFDLALSRR